MDLKNYQQIINGKFVEASNLFIPSNDSGFLRGFGVFDLFITYSGIPFHLEDHIKRLFNSAKLISLSIPYAISEICSWVLKGLDVNKDKTEKLIRIIVTGGTLINSMTPNDKDPLIIVMFGSFTRPDSALYENGAKAFTAAVKRSFPEAKTMNYLDAVVLFQNPEHRGAAEFIYHDGCKVYEGASSNVFALAGNQLVTSKSSILKGITRKVIIEKLGVNVVERDLSLNELKDAKEIFITSSVREILPITVLDNRKVGTGKVGEVTGKVINEFKEYSQGDFSKK